jgi:hypothetical protein
VNECKLLPTASAARRLAATVAAPCAFACSLAWRNRACATASCERATSAVAFGWCAGAFVLCAAVAEVALSKTMVLS